MWITSLCLRRGSCYECKILIIVTCSMGNNPRLIVTTMTNFSLCTCNKK